MRVGKRVSTSSLRTHVKLIPVVGLRFGVRDGASAVGASPSGGGERLAANPECLGGTDPASVTFELLALNRVKGIMHYG